MLKFALCVAMLAFCAATAFAANGETPSFVVRDPVFTAALSALFPGGGQFLNGQPAKGWAVVGGEILGFAFAIGDAIAHHPTPRGLILPIAYAASIADAAWSAHTFNQRQVTAGFLPQTPPEVNHRITFGVNLLLGNSELFGIAVEAEYRVGAVGVSIAHSNKAGTSMDDDLTLANLRLYLNGNSPYQIYGGWEYGVQKRSSESLTSLKYIYSGPITGISMRLPDSPMELRASFGTGRRKKADTGYTRELRYGRWMGGAGLAF